MFIRQWVKNQIGFPMSFRISLTLPLFIVMCLLTLGCRKDPDPLSSNSVVNGYAYFGENMGAHYVVDVVASGPYGKKSAKTDDQNHFRIPNLPNGTYELEYSLEGYGTVRQYGIQLFGNDSVTINPVVLYSLPSKLIMPKFTSCYWHNNNLLISTDYTVEGSYWPVRLFFSRDENVSYDNYESTLATTADYLNEIHVYDWAMTFPSSATVYVIGYVCNTLDMGYYDTYSGKRIYSTLVKDRHSNILSFKRQ